MPQTTMATRLTRQARPLKPDRAPYYLHTPGDHPAEQAPGWYMTPASAPAPIYLGAQALTAARTIDRLVDAARSTAA